jgi:hypothetical protein
MRLFLLLSILSASNVFAMNRDLKPMCEQVAQDAAVKANKKMFGAETGPCGIKILHLGDQLETYLACVSDETDPSEWVVVVKRQVFDKKTRKLTGTCKVQYSGYAVDAATPDFD